MSERRSDDDVGDGMLHFPGAGPTAVALGLAELDSIYAFLHARVGNRFDAEDLTQQVAMKAIPRLHEGASLHSIRAYLFTTARTVLAGFWAGKFGLPIETLQEELAESLEFRGTAAGGGVAEARVTRILAGLPENYRRLLELRFLKGYSLKEVAVELGSTVGAVKVMQLRALRAAARVEQDA